MRRLGTGVADAFLLDGFERGGLSLRQFFQLFELPALLDDDGVQLFDLMFKVRGVGFKLSEAFGDFFVHG
jgi:hypothetical protein